MKMRTQYVDGKGRDRKKQKVLRVQEQETGVKNHETRRSTGQEEAIQLETRG